MDLRVGGTFVSRMEAKNGSEGFDFEGTYTKIIEQRLIEYFFGDRIATVRFEEKADDIQVSVEFDAENENTEEHQRAGWQAILNNFAKHVVSS